MYCKNCGKEIVNQDGFCPQCGSSTNMHKAEGENKIKKTRLGIKITAFAALTFLSGLVSFLVMFLMAGYALAFEEDEGLKKNVLKAVVFVVVIEALNAMVGSLDNAVTALNSLCSGSLRIPLKLDIVLSNIFSLIEKVGLIFFAIKVFKGNELKIDIVDDYVNKSL